MSYSDIDSNKRVLILAELNSLKHNLTEIKKKIDSQTQEKEDLQAERKKILVSLRAATNERDRAIEQKFLMNNEINDTKAITDLERHNEEVEKKVLEEQRKFNNSKIKLDEAKEKLEMIERSLGSSHKKIEAVKREIEKVRKSKPMSTPQKPTAIAKMFSNPPPVISNLSQPKMPGSTRSGFLNFFKRN